MNSGRSSIAFDEGSGTWAIQMATSTYAIGLAENGTGLRHLHWGAPISLESLAASARPTRRVLNGRRMTLGREEPLEYQAFGGLRFDEPSLKAEFPDGTRAVQWHVSGDRIQRDGQAVLLEITLADDHYPFAVRLCYRAFDHHDVLERWACLEYRDRDGAGPVVIRQAYSADWWMPGPGPWTLRYLQGGWASETQIAEHQVATGKLVLESRRGTTSHQFNPWYAMGRTGEVSERHGDVWSGAIAWSGNWKMVIERTPSGRHHVCGGWNDFDAPLVLDPGQTLALPVFTGCWSDSGFGGASRAWHDYQCQHVLRNERRAGGSPSFPSRALRPAGELSVRPVLYNSWEATSFAVSEQHQLKLAERAARLGAELFVLDDGWFSGRDDEFAGLGDWFADSRKFPNGLGPLIDGVKGLGMGFGLWIEPEMVNPDSDLYRAHPDWVYHFQHRSRTQARHQLVLNLARHDVAEWMYKGIDRLLSESGIDFIKWDMNRYFSEPGWPDRAGSNPERMWIDHVRNLYSILERLRQAHPRVTFESCASGGGRIDLGILSRVEQVWTSDNTDAWDRIAIQEGFSQVYPAVTMMAWVTDSPNPLTGRRLPLSYRFHVAMTGALGIGGDLMTWTEAEFDEAQGLVAQYKAARHVIQLGQQHRLASTRHGDIGAVQYMTRDGAEVVVLAYWGVRRYGPYPLRLQLTALDAAKSYRDRATGTVRSGAELMRFGLDVSGPLDFGSVFAHLERLGG